MKHVKALTIKFIMSTAVLYVALSLFFGVDFGDVLWLSLVLTGAAYILGDLWILPRYGNVSATIADFGLAFIVIMLMGGAMIEETIPLFAASLISAAIIAIGEAFFHNYMTQQVLDDDRNEGNEGGFYNETDLRTEVAEENNVQDLSDSEREADEAEQTPDSKENERQ